MKLLFVVIATLCLALGASFSSEDTSRRLSAVIGSVFGSAQMDEYLTAEVTIGHIRRTISATGSLQAVSTVEVSSQLSGQIARLHADFNDTVITGQSLAELDQRSFRARVVQAESAIQMARENVAILAAQLDRARGSELETIARRKIFGARIDKADVTLDAAGRQLARTETLASRGTAASSTVEDAQSARDAAAAELREAEAVAEAHEHVVASSRAGRREAEAELANAEAALPLQEAALVLARLDLERSTIRAPIDGVVVGRNVEQGQTVATSLEAPVLFTIVGDLAEMEIHANIDETDIGEIAVGQSADFTVDAFPNRSFSARISEIRKAARFVQGVVIYTVILQTSNPERLLLPGMTSTVRIVVEEVGPVRTLPLAALRFAPGDPSSGFLPGNSGTGQIVWVLDPGGTPQPRNILLGVDDARDVAVIDGTLSQGEQVITGRTPRPAGRSLFGIRF